MQSTSFDTDIGDELQNIHAMYFLQRTTHKIYQTILSKTFIINLIIFNELMNNSSKAVIKNLCCFVETIISSFKKCIP